jgi:hypothetical protein
MDYDKKYTENTIGFMLIVGIAVGDKNRINAYPFKKDDKQIFTHIENWEKHFEKEEKLCNEAEVHFTHSITILQNIFYSNIKTPSVLQISKEQLKKLLK